jgi:hypothetical protein
MEYYAQSQDKTLVRNVGTGVNQKRKRNNATMRVFKRQEKKSNGKKKTRQGNSTNTKRGTKASKKYYKKKYRGQGR